MMTEGEARALLASHVPLDQTWGAHSVAVARAAGWIAAALLAAGAAVDSGPGADRRIAPRHRAQRDARYLRAQLGRPRTPLARRRTDPGALLHRPPTRRPHARGGGCDRLAARRLSPAELGRESGNDRRRPGGGRADCLVGRSCDRCARTLSRHDRSGDVRAARRCRGKGPRPHGRSRGDHRRVDGSPLWRSEAVSGSHAPAPPSSSTPD